MRYVIYNEMTTKILRVRAKHFGVGMFREYYESERAAKAGLTRYRKKHPEDRQVWLIASVEDHQKIERVERVQSLIGGGTVVQSVNTPLCCDPSSETYWSM